MPTYLHTYIPTYLHTYIPTYLHTPIPPYPHTHIYVYIYIAILKCCFFNDFDVVIACDQKLAATSKKRKGISLEMYKGNHGQWVLTDQGWFWPEILQKPHFTRAITAAPQFYNPVLLVRELVAPVFKQWWGELGVRSLLLWLRIPEIGSNPGRDTTLLGPNRAPQNQLSCYHFICSSRKKHNKTRWTHNFAVYLIF